MGGGERVIGIRIMERVVIAAAAAETRGLAGVYLGGLRLALN